MHHLTITTFGVLRVCALAACTPNPPAPPSTANLAANKGAVTFSGGAFAVGIGFQWGNGTLTYQGQQYPFKLNGLSVIDVGATGVSGSGKVRNLYSSPISVATCAASAGVTVAGGGAVSTLRNQNGVVIDAVSTAQGGRLTLAPGGVSITLSSQ